MALVDTPETTSGDVDEFDAFISYSRKDKVFAARLERALEAYRPPKALPVPSRRLRVFRDEGDMTGAEYYASLDKTLARTRKLIVVCSPSARASDYVNDEIRRFAAARGSEHLVPVLLEGVPNNEAGPGEANRMAFPDALCEALEMPLATSYLGFADDGGRPDGRAFEGSWYALLANLYDISREVVEQRERKRRRRRQLVVTATVSTVMIALAALAITAWLQAGEAERQRAAADVQRVEAQQQRDEAQRQRAEAERQRAAAEHQSAVLHARQLAFQAQALIDTGIGAMQSRGTLLAVEAMRRWPSAEATAAIHRVLALRRPLLWQASGGGAGPGAFIAFNATGTRLVAVGDFREPARVLDSATGTMALEMPESFTRVAWAANGTHLAGATRDSVLVLTPRGAIVRQIRHANVTALAFSADGERIATSSDGRSVLVWRVADGRRLAKLTVPVEARYPEASSLSFHPDGDLIAGVTSVGDSDNPESFRVVVWSTKRRARTRTLTFDGSVDAAAFSPDGELLAVGVRGTVRLLDVETWQERARVGKDESRSMVSVTFDGSGWLVAAVGWDEPARVWRVSDGREVARFAHERAATGGGRVSAIALGPHGRYAATIGDDMLRMWRLSPAAPIQTPSSRRGQHDRRLLEFENIASPRAGERGVAMDASRRIRLKFDGQTASVREGATGPALARFRAPWPILRGLLSPDGRLAALIGEEGGARIFDARTGEELIALRQASGVKLAALSAAAGVAVFINERGSLTVRGVADGATIARIRIADPVVWAGFSPQGRWLLTSADGIAFQALEVVSGRRIASFTHDRPIATYLFSSDERYLATASDSDGTARIWDVVNDRDLLRWHLETNLAEAKIGFSEDERTFVFSGTRYDDTQLSRVGRWRPADLVEAACQTVNRVLTDDEWRRYFPASVRPRATCPGAPVPATDPATRN